MTASEEQHGAGAPEPERHEPERHESEQPGHRDPVGEAGGHAHGGGDDGEPADELAAVRDECARLEDQLKRAMADLANFRRRQLQEAESIRRSALEGVMGELVSVLDIFGHAVAAYDGIGDGAQTGSVDALVQGVRMTETMLVQALERNGLKKIEALGKPFDPNVHEAAGFDPEADVETGCISKVLRDGYLFRDQVLRASRVLVSGTSPGSAAADPDDEHERS